jgi:hypothetical protein
MLLVVVPALQLVFLRKEDEPRPRADQTPAAFTDG